MTEVVRLADWRYFQGASWHSKEPCVEVTLALDEAIGLTTVDLQNALARLTFIHSDLDWVPKIPANDSLPLIYAQAICGVAHYLLNAVRGHIKTQRCIATELPNQVLIVVGAHEHALTKAALQLSADLIALGLSMPQAGERVSQVKNALDRFWISCRQHHPDFQARILMLGADKRGLGYFKSVAGDRHWQYGSGHSSLICMETKSSLDAAIGVGTSHNKLNTTQWLASCGFPVPKQWLVASSDDLEKVWNARTGDLVIKPLDNGQGRGVTVGIKTYPMALSAFEVAKSLTRQSAVLVEEFVPGDDFRVLVIGGKVVAVTKRVPPWVVGDGQSTVSELVEQLNQTRNSDVISRRYLKQISPVDELMRCLRQQGLAWDAVPEEGLRVQLRGNANVSTGGVPVDVTRIAHRSVLKTAEQIARQFGIYAIGIDYISTDIERSPLETGGRFIEINTTPGLDVHVASGIAEADLGDRFLPKHLKDAFVSVHIGRNADLQKEIDTDLKAWLKDGFFIAVSGLLMLNDGQKITFNNLRDAVKCALSRFDCHKLLVLCDSEYFKNNGLPVVFADELVVDQMEDSLVDKVKRAANALNARIVGLSSSDVLNVAD